MLRTICIATLTTIAMPLVAQAADDHDAQWRSADDIGVLNAQGEKLGEIDGILIDRDGRPAGFEVDMDDGDLSLRDGNIAVPLDALEWNNGEYVSKMADEQLKELPSWDG